MQLNMLFCIFSTCLIFFCSVSCDEAKFIHNDLSNKMSQEFLGLVIHYVNENLTFRNMSQRLTDVFDKEYGNGWQCLITKDDVGFNVDAQKTTKSWLLYNGINIILFKPKPCQVIYKLYTVQKFNCNIFRRSTSQMQF